MTNKPFPSLLFIVLLAFGLRLAGLDSQSLWWDELKTVQRAAMSFPELMADLASHRAHLPLYFWLMQFWQQIGNNAFIMRFFSVIWGVVSVTAVFRLGQQVASTQVGILGAFLLAISPFHIWYSQEARMYTLLPALLIFAHIFLVAALHTNKVRSWLLYTIFIAAAVATHYFALFVVMAHYIFFVLQFRRLRAKAIRWFLSIGLVGLFLFPLAWFVVSSRGNETLATVPRWINSIQGFDLLLTLWNFSLGPGISLDQDQGVGYLATAVFLLGLLVAATQMRLPKTQEIPPHTLLSRLLFAWFALPLSLTWLISLNWPFLPSNPFSLYLDRYLIITLPAFLLLVAWGITLLAAKSLQKQEGNAKFSLVSVTQIWIRPFFIFLAVIASGVSIWQLSHNPDHFRSDWRTALRLVTEKPSGPIVVLGQQDIVLPVEYYGRSPIIIVPLPPPDGGTITAAYAAVMAQQVETAVQQNTLAWHVEPFYNHHTHQFPDARRQEIADERQAVAQSWLKNNFTAVAQYNLPGLRLTLYDLENEQQQNEP